MINVREILEEIKASPYILIHVDAPHTGVVRFEITEPNTSVTGPSGAYKEKPGSLIAKLERERNVKPITAPRRGKLESVELGLEGAFVQAGERLATIRHYLTRDEVIEIILRKALYLMPAPERAAYYFVPEVDKKVKAGGYRSVTVSEGMDLLIMSRMKRETVLPYTGPTGQIYSVYFTHDKNVDAGGPLIGVCPGDQLQYIQEVVGKVRSEWEEPR